MGRAFTHPLFPFFAMCAGVGAAAVSYWRDPSLSPESVIGLALAAAALAIGLRNGQLAALQRALFADKINGLNETVDDLIEVHEELRRDVDALYAEDPSPSTRAGPEREARPLSAPERRQMGAAQTTGRHDGLDARDAGLDRKEPPRDGSRIEEPRHDARVDQMWREADPIDDDITEDALDAEFRDARARTPTEAPVQAPVQAPRAQVGGSIVDSLRAAAPQMGASASDAPDPAARRPSAEVAHERARSRVIRDLERQREELDALRRDARALDERRQSGPKWLDKSQSPKWSRPRFVRAAGASTPEKTPAQSGPDMKALPAPAARPTLSRAQATPPRRRSPRDGVVRTVVEIESLRGRSSAGDRFDPELADARHGLTLQPMASLVDGKPLFFEAAAQPRADGAATRSADADRDSAKIAGRLSAIDNLAVIQSVNALDKLSALAPEIGVFCNISLHSLRDDAFSDALLRYLDDRRSVASRLVIEVSQVEIGPTPDKDAAILSRLRDRGLGLSLDHVIDLSLEPKRFERLGFRYVKLDCQTTLAREAASPGALSHLTGSFRRAGLDIVVERIDTPMQMRALKQAGVRFGQGAVYGAPASLSAVLADLQIARASRRARGAAAAQDATIGAETAATTGA